MRGTTRSRERLAEIEAAGAEAVVADPDRLATLMPHVEGVSVLCWLLGQVVDEALHGPRLESMLEALVDTPVRGVVYEGPGEDLVRSFSDTYKVPVEVLEPGSADWPAEARAAVAKVLA